MEGTFTLAETSTLGIVKCCKAVYTHPECAYVFCRGGI